MTAQRDALIAEYADAVTEDKGMVMMNQGEMREFTHSRVARRCR